MRMTLGVMEWGRNAKQSELKCQLFRKVMAWGLQAPCPASPSSQGRLCSQHIAHPLLQGQGAISPSLLVARQPRMSLRGHFADNSELSPQPVNRWFCKQPAPARNRLLWLCRAFPAATVTRNFPRAPSLRCAVHVAWKEKWPKVRLYVSSGQWLGVLPDG